jgi:uncharacterized protein YhaN
MRIERIELDGFGRFHDAHWELSEGLTVLLGANEAGKTTLLNAVRALLFGFESSRDGRAWYPALAGGRRGGRLRLLTAQGERWTVERHGERGGGGALAVRAPSGNQGGQETLDRLLHGADKDLFSNIFAFGLGELQALSSLSAEGVRGRIYGARAGLGGTSALDLERRLRQQLDGTFLPGGSKRPLNALLGRIEELHREVADLARQPEEHAAAHRERERLVARAETLRREIRAQRERLARIAAVRAAMPIAAELAGFEEALAAGDASLDDLPEDAITLLDHRAAARAEARAVLAQIDEQLEDARRRRVALRVDEPVLAEADEIAAVAIEASRRDALETRARDLEAGEQRQATIVIEQVTRAGVPSEDDLIVLDDSIPAVEATREHEQLMSEARAVVTQAAQQRQAAADELEARAREIGDPEGEADDELERRSELVAELAGLRVRRAAAEARAGGLSTSHLATRLLAAAAGAGIGLAAGLVVATPIPGAALGAMFALVVVLALERRRQPHRDRNDLGAIDRERAALMERLGLGVDAGEHELRAVADAVATGRARHELARQHRASLEVRRAELDRRERRVATATSDLAQAEAGWSRWLADHRLAPGITPEAARHLLVAAGTARRAAQERDHLRAELATLRVEEAAFARRADALLARLGIVTPADAARRAAAVVGLAERLERARADQRDARQLDAGIASLDARRQVALAEVQERTAALEEFLTSLGCPDEVTLRRRAAAAARRRTLHAGVGEHRSKLALIAGGLDGLGALVEEARTSDPAALQAAEAEAGQTLERLESEERAGHGRIGALEAQISRLESADELGARRQELAVAEGRATALAREWAIRALALCLLEETRSHYERERQPDVVRAAESHFERITDARYTRIVAPPGDASVRVETDGGESRSTDELSRGTSEQLYLALRFGLIEEFAQHAEPLPVVMDDILVNFDADRASRAAAAIRDLAARHQVLYFTCHPVTAQLLDPGGTRTLALG